MKCYIVHQNILHLFQKITLKDSFNTCSIYWDSRRGFFLKFGTKICVVILNSRMKHWTRPCQTRLLWCVPCRDTHGLRCPLVTWDHGFSEILHSVEWYFPANILGQPISLILRGKEIQNETRAW